MNKKVTSIIISLILVAIIPTALAISSISVFTDKTLYDRADAITIYGQVSEVIENTFVTIEIFNEGNLIETAQLFVAQNGNFTHAILADGSQWKNPGTYTIKVSTTEENITETTFDFISPSVVEQIPEPELESIPEQKPIPEWVKGVFTFWADGQISDQELKNAIRFLVKSGIIVI